jgi:hypothetical protein
MINNMEQRRGTRKAGGVGLSGVAIQLLAECGMISGVGFPDPAKAGLLVKVSPVPEAVCSRSSVHPVSKRNRINQVFGSDSRICAQQRRPHGECRADAAGEERTATRRLEVIEPFRELLRLNVL